MNEILGGILYIAAIGYIFFETMYILFSMMMHQAKERKWIWLTAFFLAFVLYGIFRLPLFAVAPLFVLPRLSFAIKNWLKKRSLAKLVRLLGGKRPRRINTLDIRNNLPFLMLSSMRLPMEALTSPNPATSWQVIEAGKYPYLILNISANEAEDILLAFYLGKNDEAPNVTEKEMLTFLQVLDSERWLLIRYFLPPVDTPIGESQDVRLPVSPLPDISRYFVGVEKGKLDKYIQHYQDPLVNWELMSQLWKELKD